MLKMIIFRISPPLTSTALSMNSGTSAAWLRATAEHSCGGWGSWGARVSPWQQDRQGDQAMLDKCVNECAVFYQKELGQLRPKLLKSQ
jgi:hypothetical protein